MRFLSVCSGIEAASLAWGPLGWRAVAFSEIDPFACALLAQRYPRTPNLGDMTNFREWPDDLRLDILCGGTPCQSYSNAGLRAGLADPRGQLMLVFAAIAAKYRPRWLVWENVPGVLSSNGGRDFAQLLGILTGQRVTPPRGGWQNTGVLGGIADAYGVAWRVFDAQYAGLAQRRERVFLVGHLGDWRRAAAVLLERQSLRGDPAPSRGAGQDTAGDAAAGAEVGSRPISATLDANYGKLQGASGQDANHGHSTLVIAGALRATDGGADLEHARANHLVAFGGNNTAGPIHVAPAVRAHGTAHYDFESEGFLVGPAATLTGGGRKRSGYSADDRPMAIAFKPSHFTRGKDGAPQDTVSALTADADKGDQDPVVLAPVPHAFPGGMSGTQTGSTPDQAPSLTRGNTPGLVTPAMAVRRFMPVECERLQGMPEGYTAITYRGKPAADSPRYKGIGNSWAIPCVTWIGQRIEHVEAAMRFLDALGGVSLEM